MFTCSLTPLGSALQGMQCVTVCIHVSLFLCVSISDALLYNQELVCTDAAAF